MQTTQDYDSLPMTCRPSSGRVEEGVEESDSSPLTARLGVPPRLLASALMKGLPVASVTSRIPAILRAHPEMRDDVIRKGRRIEWMSLRVCELICSTYPGDMGIELEGLLHGIKVRVQAGD